MAFCINFAHISGKTNRVFVLIYNRYIFGQDIFVKFWNSSAFGLFLWTLDIEHIHTSVLIVRLTYIMFQIYYILFYYMTYKIWLASISDRFLLLLLATLCKKYWLYHHENCTRIVAMDRKKWLNSGSHLPLDPHLGIFWRIIQHCEMGIFTQFGSYLWIFVKILSEMYIFTRKFPLNFGSYRNLESRSGLRIQCGFTLAEVMPSECSGCRYVFYLVSSIFFC